MRTRLLVFFPLIVIALVFIFFFSFREPKSNGYLTLYGNVDVRQVDLGFRVSGRVIAMPFQEGDLVPEGTFMGTLDKQPYLDLVREAEANVEVVRRQLANAEEVVKRREIAVTSGAVPVEDYHNAITSRDVYKDILKQAEASFGVASTNLHDTELYSPSDGTILTRIREPGTVVREADPIYTLSLISPVWVRAFVAEPSLGLIYPGMLAEIHTDTKDGPVYKGHIGFISPVAEFTPKTVETTQLRTDLVYRLRVIADNPDQGLRQGMPVTVKLLTKSGAGE